LFRNACAFQIKLKFGNVGFKERGKAEYQEKTLSEQDTLAGGERSHYCAIPASLRASSCSVKASDQQVKNTD